MTTLFLLIMKHQTTSFLLFSSKSKCLFSLSLSPYFTPSLNNFIDVPSPLKSQCNLHQSFTAKFIMMLIGCKQISYILRSRNNFFLDIVQYIQLLFLLRIQHPSLLVFKLSTSCVILC